MLSNFGDHHHQCPDPDKPRSKANPPPSAHIAFLTVSLPPTPTLRPPSLLGWFNDHRQSRLIIIIFRRCDSRNLNLSPFCSLSSKSSLLKWQPTVIVVITIVFAIVTIITIHHCMDHHQIGCSTWWIKSLNMIAVFLQENSIAWPGDVHLWRDQHSLHNWLAWPTQEVNRFLEPPTSNFWNFLSFQADKLIVREYPGSMATSEILSSLTEVNIIIITPDMAVVIITTIIIITW